MQNNTALLRLGGNDVAEPSLENRSYGEDQWPKEGGDEPVDGLQAMMGGNVKQNAIMTAQWNEGQNRRAVSGDT